ncbi:hypothetical protein ACWGJT_31940 [Streptomyces xantholiticus]
MALLSLYEAHRRPTDLKEALAIAREATGYRTPPHPQQALHLSNRCSAALANFDVFADPDLLDEAITAATEAVDRASPDDPDLALYQSNLTAARTQRFAMLTDRCRATVEDVLLTGRSDLLSSAVADGRAAIEAAPETEPRRWVARSNTSHALRLRYEAVGEDADLDDAVELAREALALVREVSWPTSGDLQEPARGPELSCLINLSAALMTRFFVTSRPDHGDEAVALCRQAAALAQADSGLRAVTLSNLAGTLQARARGPRHSTQNAERAVRAESAEHSVNAEGHAEAARRRDLDEAVQVCRRAVEAADKPLDRAVYRANLANALLARATGPADTDEAIENARRAVQDLPKGGTEWAIATANIATALSARWQAGPADQERQAEGDEVVTEACGHWRAVVAAATVAPAVRVAAARDASVLAARAGGPGTALAFAADAVDLLPLLAWQGLRWNSRVGHLTRLPSLATDAAALAAGVDSPRRALVLAEHGRAVLWSQLLDLRGDLGALERTAPGLAGRLAEIRDQLDHQVTS